jgi:hypothetical protein
MSKHLAARIVLAVLMTSCGPSFADGNCPAGYYESSGGGVSGCIAYPTASGQPPDPGPQWGTRWGAIAAGDGAFGAANQVKSKRKAQSEALKQCRAKGGQKCKVSIAFDNQCGAIAWGDEFYATAGESTLESASKKALEFCGKNTKNCEIFYSACSYPERLR